MMLDELSDRVARELGVRGLLGAAADGRVSAAPDARTVRYYTTLGLLDRPRIDAARRDRAEALGRWRRSNSACTAAATRS